MKNKTSHNTATSAIAGVLLGAILASSAVFADDTEVFFGYKDPDDTIFPNVMLVLDSSAAMNKMDPPEPHNRITRTKQAMQIILDNAANVNMGFMRYPGESVESMMYPIRYIDERVCEGSGCGSVDVNYQITRGANDGWELMSDSLATSLDSLSLPVGPYGADGNYSEIAMRFEGVQIPTQATIVSAYIEFYPAQEAITTDLQGLLYTLEDAGDSTELSDAANDIVDRKRISTTLPMVKLSSDWTQAVDETGAPLVNADGTPVFDPVQSADLSPALQQVVDSKNWCGGQALTVFAQSSDVREIVSFNQNPELAPRLIVNYDASNIPVQGGCMLKNVVARVNSSADDASEKLSSGSMDTTADFLELSQVRAIGVRFNNVDIPPLSEIQSAHLEFVGANYSATTTADNAELSAGIWAEYVPDAAHFAKFKRNISSRTLTNTSIGWDDMPLAIDDTRFESPDISELVQQLVNQGDWLAGNDMAFVLKGVSGTGRRQYSAFDTSSVNAPMLRIKYRTVKVGSTTETTISAREEMKQAITAFKSTRGAPIVETMADAADYFHGLPIGNSGQQYPSPVTSACQTNHLVFLTAGDPSSADHEDRVRAMIDPQECAAVARKPEICGNELAHWMNSTDTSPDIIGKQTINIHTVALGEHNEFMRGISSYGGGDYYIATSVQDMVDVYTEILGQIMNIDTSFVAPAATVNQFNRLTHDNDIYFSLFRPMSKPKWQGNLKKYELGQDTQGVPTILDANGLPAVDNDTGFFADWSKDRISSESLPPDGKTVAKGGAASRLAEVTRQIFTNISGDTNVLLTASGNELSEQNASQITKTALGIPDATDDYHRQVLAWARGVDVRDEDQDEDFTEMRLHMGDPMHSKPLIATYSDGREMVLVATNEGYLHAFESVQGHELWSFVPRDLLPNLPKFYENLSFEDHPYGLDGELSLFTTNPESRIQIGSDTAMIYVGMRRGGRNYYAIDISDYNNPRLAWVIRGGSSEFPLLSQSWSRAVPTRMTVNGSVRDVLVFGGGYDPNQDSDVATSTIRTPDTLGTAIYIVDALTGYKLWEGTPGTFSRMKFGIPSEVAVVDADFDGIADMMFAGDMGGQLWRFDIGNATNGSLQVHGGVIADLAVNNDVSATRRFFYKPDIAMMADEGERLLSIAFGSGWRAHPLDLVVEDRFYMLKDKNIYAPPADYRYGKYDATLDTYRPYTESDLVNITVAGSTTGVDFSDADGWMLEMTDSGEKVLSTSTTSNGQLVFTSYKPTRQSDVCDTSIGGGSVYVLDLLTGEPTLDLDNDGDIDEDDRSKDLKHGGISPEPTVLITEQGDPIILVGPQQPLKEFDFGNLTVRTYWREDIVNLDGQ